MNEELENDINGYIRNSLRRGDRFDNYREITARFDSIGKCGHKIKKGDTIGYNRHHGCRCSSCWSSWVAENREADMIERGEMNCCW